jgi:DNA ligase D-like protein (predicted polymerase)
VSSSAVTVEVDGRQVRVTNPDKVLFPVGGHTKLDLVEHHLRVAPGALRAVRSRPTVLHRFPDGVDGKDFFQKRVPASRPDWLQTARVTFPAGGHAEELCPADTAHLVWAANLGSLTLHPWAVRRWDLDHPDELRVDLDPQPGVPWATVRRVTAVTAEVLAEHGLVGWPKTSGSRGIHVNVRIVARWPYTEVRRAALALAREVERRLPDAATAAWWKEERGDRVFLDFNQNLPDRTVASAYSVRAHPDAPVSAPFRWDELDDIENGDITLATMAARWADVGDLEADMDETHHSLESLLEQADRDRRDGLGDAPWPPNFPKMPGEPPRVQPSRARDSS